MGEEVCTVLEAVLEQCLDLELAVLVTAKGRGSNQDLLAVVVADLVQCLVLEGNPRRRLNLAVEEAAANLDQLRARIASKDGGFLRRRVKVASLSPISMMTHTIRAMYQQMKKNFQT